MAAAAAVVVVLVVVVAGAGSCGATERHPRTVGCRLARL